MLWTADKIASLAANPAAEKRGRDTARPAAWSNIGTDGQYIWGECKGSGTVPYKTQVNLQQPAFSCTCPLFAKPPCKHALGLLFYWEQHKNAFPAPDFIPEWVARWKAKHRPAAEEKTIVAPVLSEKELQEQARSRAQRRAKRLNNMQSGIEELELWLLDLAAQGAANADVLQSAFWDTIARRMVDAQMPRLAAYLKETAILLNNSTDWLSVLLQRLGELYLLVRTFDHLADENAADNQDDESAMDDLLTMLGVNTQKKDVLAENSPIFAQWVVAGIEEGTDVENRAFRKVWLHQINKSDSNKSDSTTARLHKALILDFAFGHTSYEQMFVWGTILQGALTYYPSATPQRALLPSFQIQSQWQALDPMMLQPFSDFDVMLDEYAADVAKNIWLTEWLTAIYPVWISHDSQSRKTFAQDSKGNRIVLSLLQPMHAFRLMSVSGGQPICIVGTLLSSQIMQPLSVLSDDALLPVQELLYPIHKMS
jgi:hypothetical protein